MIFTPFFTVRSTESQYQQAKAGKIKNYFTNRIFRDMILNVDFNQFDGLNKFAFCSGYVNDRVYKSAVTSDV